MNMTPEAVAAKILERLARVRLADNYLTDIGRTVFDGRTSVTPEECPCSTMVEAEDNVEHDARMQSYKTEQKFLLVGYDVCDLNNSNTKGRDIVRDLKRAVFQTIDGKYDRNLLGSVRVVTYKGKDLAVRNVGSPMAIAAIEIEVSYVDNIG